MSAAAQAFIGRLQRELPQRVLVYGDEPLQLGECLAALRAAARREGCEERLYFEGGNDFQWQELEGSGDNLSLFSARRLFEVRLTTRPGAEGAAAMQHHADSGSEDVLVMACPDLDGRARNTAWFRTIDALAVCVRVSAVPPPALPAWLAERFRRHDLEASADACELLAERTEGNLLAAAQEVDKLALLVEGGRIDVEHIDRAAGDSARFDSFALVDAAVDGDAPRVVRVLRGLRAEGMDVLPLLGTVTWMLRTLHAVAERREAGDAIDRVLRQPQFGQLRRRAAAVQALLARADSRVLGALLGRALQVDMAVKGEHVDEPWSALERLCLALAGRVVLRERL